MRNEELILLATLFWSGDSPEILKKKKKGWVGVNYCIVGRSKRQITICIYRVLRLNEHQNRVKTNRYKIRHINIFLGKGSFQIKPKPVDHALYLMD